MTGNTTVPIPTLTSRSLEHRTYTEWFLTGRPAPGRPPAEAVRDVFAQAAEFMAHTRIQPLQEKVYGLIAERTRILATRREALARCQLDTSMPLTFLEGAPPDGGFGGVQLWGIAPRTRDERLVDTVELNGAPVGRRLTLPGLRLVTLSAISGVADDGSLAGCAPCQARRMFTNASGALAALDLDFRHVKRTWIYLARILDWYGEFNRVRTAHFATAGLAPGAGVEFPASTGIQGRGGGEECLMDLLAVDAQASSGFLARPVVRSSRQDKAFSYGSAFSRAMVLEQAGKKTFFISGTASIDSEGNSVSLDDPEAQCLHTLMALAALLEEQGGGLEHVCQATVFCKNASVVEAWRNVSRRLRLPELPAICVMADVCRPELLVEIEAVAQI